MPKKDIFKNTIEYKEYVGTVEVDEEKEEYVGRVLGVKDEKLVYRADNYDDFIKGFHNVVDKYIKEKLKKNEEVGNPFKGCFNVRVKPEVHKAALAYAKEHNISLSKLVSIALSEKIYK